MPLSSKKFRKILNDLKRRPEDAAKDLGMGKQKINKILTSEKFTDLTIIESS